MKVIEGLTADQIRNVNVPTGQPRVYEFEAGGLGGLSLKAPGRWLDPDAASRGARKRSRWAEATPRSDVARAGRLNGSVAAPAWLHPASSLFFFFFFSATSPL